MPAAEIPRSDLRVERLVYARNRELVPVSGGCGTDVPEPQIDVHVRAKPVEIESDDRFLLEILDTGKKTHSHDFLAFAVCTDILFLRSVFRNIPSELTLSSVVGVYSKDRYSSYTYILGVVDTCPTV